MMLVLIPMFIVFRDKWIYILVASVLILLVSIFMIYDTQMIANGKKYGLSYDDYIIAALLLYTVRLYKANQNFLGCDHSISMAPSSLGCSKVRIQLTY
jgi:hypothetical protein